MTKTIKRNCPVCGERMVLLFSLNKKLCCNCKQEYDWELDEGQKPVFGGKRDDN